MKKIMSHAPSRSRAFLAETSRDFRSIVSEYNNEKRCNIEVLDYFVGKTIRASNRKEYPRIKDLVLDFTCEDGSEYSMTKEYLINDTKKSEIRKKSDPYAFKDYSNEVVVSGKGSYMIKNVIKFPEGTSLPEYTRMLTTEPQRTPGRSILRSSAIQAGGPLATDIISLAIKNYTNRLYPLHTRRHSFKMTLKCTSVKDTYLEQKPIYIVTITKHFYFVPDYDAPDSPRRVSTDSALITVKGERVYDRYLQTNNLLEEARFIMIAEDNYEIEAQDALLRNTQLKTLVVNSGSVECFYPIQFELPKKGTIAQYKEVFARIMREHKNHKQPPPLPQSFFDARRAEEEAALAEEAAAAEAAPWGGKAAACKRQ